MELNIVSFNIRCCDDPNGHSIPERAPRLKAVIDACAPDLIALQEYRPEWEKHIAEAFLGEYEFLNKYRSEGDDKESGPILWKKDAFTLIDRGWFWLSDTPEVESRGWDELYNCYRICLWAILEHKATGKRFNFMNTHFGFGDKGQCDSVKLIADYSDKISDLPTFICGDFNMTPAKPAYAEMVKYFTDVNAVTGNDLRDTFHNYTPHIPTNAHIDYCFVKNGIKPLSQVMLDQSFDGKYPSDHFGLNIRLEI